MELRIGGVILSDHLKNLDWRQRQAQKAGKIPRAILEQVRSRIATLLKLT
jgi:mRNA-degrading endonuclease toxin of MazEF toxin-antitoxin module